jgi:hypothetical protein
VPSSDEVKGDRDRREPGRLRVRETDPSLGYNDPVEHVAPERSEPAQPAAAFDTSLARRVHEHYLADFGTYGYDEESWRFE